MALGFVITYFFTPETGNVSLEAFDYAPPEVVAEDEKAEIEAHKQ